MSNQIGYVTNEPYYIKDGKPMANEELVGRKQLK